MRKFGVPSFNPSFGFYMDTDPTSVGTVPPEVFSNIDPVKAVAFLRQQVPDEDYREGMSLAELAGAAKLQVPDERGMEMLRRSPGLYNLLSQYVELP